MEGSGVRKRKEGRREEMRRGNEERRGGGEEALVSQDAPSLINSLRQSSPNLERTSSKRFEGGYQGGQLGPPSTERGVRGEGCVRVRVRASMKLKAKVSLRRVRGRTGTLFLKSQSITSTFRFSNA